MSAVLEVEDLCKTYPKFQLDHVSFSVEKGSIMGLIGRNGAGKTTTMKSILNLIHISSGEIRYFGEELSKNEDKIKERIGYAGGAIDYYRKKKIRDIVRITKQFYPNWDEEFYASYMDLFHLDENKTPSELSEGMKVKLNLTIALSHHAELLILDEPTSGLDPVSREELLEVFQFLASKGISILFSTHITSDLEKCADHITYIRNGKVEKSCSLEEFVGDGREKGYGSTLEDIMVYYEKDVDTSKLQELYERMV